MTQHRNGRHHAGDSSNVRNTHQICPSLFDGKLNR